MFSSDFMPHGVCYLWRPEIIGATRSLTRDFYYVVPRTR